MPKEATVAAPEPVSSHRSIWLSVMLLTGGVVLAYFNSFSVPLLFDDRVAIQDNPAIRQLWPGEASPPGAAPAAGGRPVVRLSLAINYALGGESVGGYHGVNLAIHLAATLALFGCVRRTLRRASGCARGARDSTRVAGVAAGVWALHPIHTVAVTYLSQRSESLMGLFCFLTLYGYGRAVEAPNQWRWRCLSVGSCALGMATKESMVSAPLVVLLYDWAFVSGSPISSWKQRRSLLLALAATWAVLGLSLGALPERAVGYGLGVSAWSYLLVQAGVILRYLRLTLFPWPLVFDYGPDVQVAWAWGVGQAAVVGALMAAAAAAMWRQPRAGFFAACFFVLLAPTSSFVPIVLQPVAENRVYVASAFVVVALVVLVVAVGGRRLLGPFALAAAALAVATAARNRDYESAVSLWTDTAAKRPCNARAHNNLAEALLAADRPTDAVAAARAALLLNPGYAEAEANLAGALVKLERYGEAMRHARRAAELNPRLATAQYHLGVALTRSGALSGARSAFTAAIAQAPRFAEPRAILAVVLVNLGETAEAVAQAEIALRLKPGLAQARLALGCAWLRSGQFEQAAEQLELFVLADPGNRDGWQNLAVARLQTGRATDAIAAFQRVLAVDPNLAEVQSNFSIALLRAGRGLEAIQAAETAVRLNPALASARCNLALALMQTGRIDEATRQFEECLRLDPGHATAQSAMQKLRTGRR